MLSQDIAAEMPDMPDVPVPTSSTSSGFGVD
jgi:hypothetical protein